MSKKKRRTKRANKSIWKNTRIYFVLLYFIVAVAFIAQLFIIDILPILYLGSVIFGVVLLGWIMWFLQFGKNINRLNRGLGKFLIMFLVIVIGFANVYVYQGNNARNKIVVNEGDVEYDVISVVVLKDSSAKKLKDVKNEVFGVPEKIDPINTKKMLKHLKKELKKSVKTAGYASTNAQANAMYANEVPVMILNEAYRSILYDKHVGFDEETKVIYEYQIPRKVKNIGSAVDVTSEAYNVYISGLDTYGDIGTKSRSDVNMIASINPNTYQILLTSVPRDYYIKQSCQANQEDKLTHTGIFGIDCTIDSMQNFTKQKFNYYVQVNYSSLIAVVNAIGGIEVNNPRGFYSGVDSTYISAGDLHMNGMMALRFSRERYAYQEGDLQRGKNQMIVLQAIISKAISPSIVTRFSTIMDTVGNSFQTNMKASDMSKIVKKQIADGESWNVVQQSVTGDGLTLWTPANGFNAYVMVPDEESVRSALDNIKRVIKGDVLDAME